MSAIARPHLLVATGSWPCLNGHTAADNVCAHQIISALAATNQFRLSYICVSETLIAPPAAAAGDLAELRAAGVALLPPIAVPIPRLRARPLEVAQNLVLQRWESFMRGYGEHRRLVDALGDGLPDGILTIWSEFASAVIGALPVAKFAYYGNLDYRNLQAQQDLAVLEQESRGGRANPLQSAKSRALVALTRRGHYSLLRRYARVWNVSKSDADEQRAGGIDATYLSNIWPTGGTRPDVVGQHRNTQTQPLKIIGSVGRMGATANSFGLISLAREILPALKLRLGEGNFEIHLYGKPPPRDFILPMLGDRHFKLRGFVDDLEAEMMSAPVFLVANNHDKYKAGHTRILHAWSLGCCVVAAESLKSAMPELVHDENILLGRTANDIAALAADAAADGALRARIGAGGKRALAESFNPYRVAGAIADDIMKSLRQR
jgi:hypothetical protein